MKGQEDKSCKFSNRFRKFFYWYGSFVIYGMGFGVIVYLLMLGLSK